MPTFTDATNQPLTSSSIGNDILFQGRRYDKETNLYYYRARYYDPIMGRFLQTDPMGYADSMNLYQGFNMNPVNFVDPMGLSIELKPDEMVKFETNLTLALFEMIRVRFQDSPKYIDGLISLINNGYTLDMKISTFNEWTGLNLEKPVRLTNIRRVIGGAKSLTTIGKQVNEKVSVWLGSEDGQENIEASKNHWLATEDVVFPDMLTTTYRLNIAFAEGVGDLAEFTTEELQWAVAFGAIHKATSLSKYVKKIKERKLWQITRYDKVKKWGSNKIFRDPETGLWWAKDFAGHGGSAWKVFQETGKGLEWLADADKYGDYLGGKHKGPIGLFIPWKDLH